MVSLSLYCIAGSHEDDGDADGVPDIISDDGDLDMESCDVSSIAKDWIAPGMETNEE